MKLISSINKEIDKIQAQFKNPHLYNVHHLECPQRATFRFSRAQFHSKQFGINKLYNLYKVCLNYIKLFYIL